MKRVLIISPYFPPSNAADMQRIRMSLPYFQSVGWAADVVCVKSKYSGMLKDDLLMQSLLADQVIYEVDAFDVKWTSKLGLGSLALRSMWHYLKEVNRILRQKQYDLIYFSTTQFPITILGRYWKSKFSIPYVIDMQDPWHSGYYQDKPKSQRPPKYWFSYRLNKWLEPVTMKKVDGLIGVSENYISDLKERYRELQHVPTATITFGFFEPDNSIALQHADDFSHLLDIGTTNIVYVGRGGADMHRAVTPLFKALKKGLDEAPECFKKLKLYFIGTSYAPARQGKQTILPLAEEIGMGDSVIEITDRISYYHTLATLQQADALFIPGSDDPKYTASKLYPYLLTKKPLLTILHQDSPAVKVLNTCTKNAVGLTFADENGKMDDVIFQTLSNWANDISIHTETLEAFEQFNARVLTGKQVALFEKALTAFKGRLNP